jgi:FHA domain/Double zinc ribbon
VSDIGLPPESEEMAILTCPDCGVKVQPEDLICFRCGANLPHAPYADDDMPSPTVSQQYLRPGGSDGRAVCPNCGMMAQDPADVVCVQCRQPLPGARRRISPVVLRISFPTGNVDVPAGTSVILGRDPAQSLVAAAFGQYDNVSRRHATVVVDDGGRASIRDEGSTNGTFVNGDRVLPGTEVRLVDGDRIRLAADVTGDVSLPRAEPDPASLSRNGFV